MSKKMDFSCFEIGTIMQKVETTMVQVEDIWNTLEFSEEVKKERRSAISSAIMEQCDSLLSEEQCMVERLNRRVKERKEKLKWLITELEKDALVIPDIGLIHLDAFLRECLKDLQDEHQAKLQESENLIELDEELSSFLDEPSFPMLRGKLPSQLELQFLLDHIEERKQEKKERIQNYCNLRTEIVHCCSLLEEVDPSCPILKHILFNKEPRSPLRKTYLQDIKEKLSDLEFRVKGVEAESLELRERITTLWDLLQVPDSERQTFLTTIPLHTSSCISKLQEVLAKLKEERTKNMGRFIQTFQTEVSKWWEKCYVGESYKESFLTSSSSKNAESEETFDAYEAELKKWKKHYEENTQIFAKVDYLLSLFDNLHELEEKAKDPSRLFKTRGGALLLEEKERKKVQTELPRTEARLLEMGAEYEEKCGTRFVVDGLDLEKYLIKLWEYHDIRREQEKSCKKPVSTSKNLRTPTNPPPGSGSRKRMREGEETAVGCDAKRATASRRLIGPHRSPLKEMQSKMKAPFSVPRMGQAKDQQKPLPPPFALPLTDEDSFLQTTINYNRFKDALCNREDNFNSTAVGSSDGRAESTL